MKVLLLTRNHVVREFIELVAGRVGADLEVQEHADDTVGKGYDFLLVDDRGALLQEGLILLERLEIHQSIVLYSEENRLHEQFDQKVKKPFLPSDIAALLESVPAEKSLPTEEQVLNIQDIEEIRGLLESEGMEIVSEEELVDEIEMEHGISETEKETRMDEELLMALRNMEPKKIRKLLKGAEVTLTIRFPKETE